MARGGSLAHRLYTGQVSYDFIGSRRRWYAASLIVILISLASLGVRGFHLGIEFKGGAQFTVAANGHSVADARTSVRGAGATEAIVQRVGEGNLRIQTEALTENEANAVRDGLARDFAVAKADIAVSTVGPSWGREITKKALQGLAVFIVLVIAYLSVRFEPKMALAAIIAVIHDLLITAGIYSLVGFEVTPSTVIALLTILGFSLYDTVVVFDKVRENTAGLAGGSRMTFSQATNLAVNQTLVRSINTSIIALLPVAALLFIGAFLLGASTLEDLALALLIGLASGTYSSIFVASPLLCDLKEREPQFRALARRVDARRSGVAPGRGPAPSAAGATRMSPSRGRAGTAVLDPQHPIGDERDEPTGPTGPTGASGPDGPPAGNGPPDPTPALGADGGAAAHRPGRPPARPAPARRKSGGRPGRPSGKRRR